ncbi:hypothetical protein [Micromonospora aurantiaca (nom. illeg.)]|uniref:hypothetical protein n=1 Tax=Micromonospora aurantiaca (nom. illeg.) TaxID=47850 RepID=UPI0033EB33B2
MMQRTAKLIRRFDPRSHQLVFPVAGQSAFSQDRRDSALGGTHLSFLDTSRPHGAIHAPTPSGEPFSTLMLQISAVPVRYSRQETD